jgi:hypothetical protein
MKVINFRAIGIENPLAHGGQSARLELELQKDRGPAFCRPSLFYCLP